MESDRSKNPRSDIKEYGLFDPSRRVVDGHTRPCEECGAVDWQLDDTRGEIICNSCGLVVEENVIDPGAEWTNRDKTEDRSRVGQPLTYTLADKGLNTSIDVRDLNTGSAGRHGISSQARRDWRRRRVIDERSKTRKSRERNLVKACLLYTSPSPRDQVVSRMPSSA